MSLWILKSALCDALCHFSNGKAGTLNLLKIVKVVPDLYTIKTCLTNQLPLYAKASHFRTGAAKQARKRTAGKHLVVGGLFSCAKQASKCYRRPEVSVINVNLLQTARDADT